MPAVILHTDRLFVIALITALTGCVSVPPPADCDRFAVDSKQLMYQTKYTFSEQKTARYAKDHRALPASTPAAAPVYKLDIEKDVVRVCSHLALQKELFLQRGGDGITIEETREFYAQDGALIASKTENLSPQLKKSGFYVATVPLPVPEKAPPGQYRVVSKLTLKKPGGKAIILAEASDSFSVIAKR
jgi:hypothetical protein